MIGLPTMIGCNLGSGSPVGVALSAVKYATEVLTKRPDGCAVLRVGIAVFNPDDHGPDGAHIMAR